MKYKLRTSDMETNAPLNSSPGFPPDCRICKSCWQSIKKTAAFCPYCGSPQEDEEFLAFSKQTENKWRTIKRMILFYFIYIGTVIPIYWIDDTLKSTGIILVSILNALIILSYWYESDIKLSYLFRINKKVMKYILLGIVAVGFLLFINYTYHRFLIQTLGFKKSQNTDPFSFAGLGFLLVVFQESIMPAFWEEIAFRGLIQTNLNRVIHVWESLFLTSIMFAIIHHSILSWPYLFLVGAVFGILRMYSNSLWATISAHFVHNLAIVCFLS